jgi:putative ABC transport system permease protein
MKQNAVGLGNIAILSTMTIIAVSGSVSLYCGIDDILNERYPDDIEITYYSNYAYSQEDIPSRENLYSTIQDTLKDSNRTMSNFKQYDTLNITVTQTEGGVLITNPEAVATLSYLPDSISILALLTLDDYNTLTGEDRTLSSDEVLMYTKGYDIPQTFNIDSDSYTVIPLDNFPIDTGYYTATGVSEIYLVLSDYSQLETIYQKRLEVYESPSHLEYVVSFSLDGTDDERLAFAETLGEKLKLPVEGKDYYINPISSKQSGKESCYSLYGGILFLGIFLGITFLMATVLIIYYKQLSEGYDDRERFNIMQKVGLSQSEVKKTIRTQVLMVFFLPLVTAIVHTAFAFPMLTYLLKALALTNVKLFLICTVACILVFTLIYVLIYSITAKVYFKITTAKN